VPPAEAAAAASQGNGGQAPKAAAAEGGGDASKPAKARRQQAPAVKPNLSVILVNETGNPGASESYRQVLSQIGYTVISSSQGPPTSQPGKTTILYQAGQDAQARALANRIPGRTELKASSEPLPAGAIVTIR
jgi:hypothetical protein